MSHISLFEIVNYVERTFSHVLRKTHGIKVRYRKNNERKQRL